MPDGEKSEEPGTITFAVSGRPLVSILIPSRNQAALLESCLRRVRRGVALTPKQTAVLARMSHWYSFTLLSVILTTPCLSVVAWMFLNW